jgi:glycosyltransferase involved in cell wall biosynthesis
MAPKVDVVLNCYRRTRWLDEQIKAVDNQTIKIDNIYGWRNESDQEVSKELQDRMIFANCNQNLGVWSRFAFALNSTADYVCVLDDDTIPGEKWIENCLETMKTNEGLLGTVGVLFGDRHYSWQKLRRVGWCDPNEETTQVDIVGHSWFFPRDLLSVLWRELPTGEIPPIVGEDIHFSHMIQKYTDLATYVPPHPKDDMSLWGSTKGEEYGHSQEGISMTQFSTQSGQRFTAGQLMGVCLSKAVDDGFKMLEAE